MKTTTQRAAYITIILVLTLSILTPTTIVRADPSVIVDTYTLTPAILMPGDTALLTIHLKNAELTNSQTTTDGIDYSHTSTIGAILNSASITPATSGTRDIHATRSYNDIGILAPAATLDLPFALNCNKTMPDGIYFITANVDVNSYTDVHYPIAIRVQNNSLTLTAKDAPTGFSQSGTTDITLTITNPRAADLESVHITAQTLPNVTWDTDQIFLGTLAAGTSREVTFSLHSNSLGSANLTFNASYYNGPNAHTTTLVIPVNVQSTLEVAPVLAGIPATVPQGTKARISLEVYNAKDEPVSGVLVIPVDTYGVYPSQYFIGTMDPDDVFSASFDIATTNMTTGEHSIAFIVSYKQGTTYYQTPPVTASFSVSNALPTGGQGGILLSGAIIFILLILGVGVYFLWYRRRKKA
jgi:hypothetical protein